MCLLPQARWHDVCLTMTLEQDAVVWGQEPQGQEGSLSCRTGESDVFCLCRSQGRALPATGVSSSIRCRQG